MSYFGFMKSRRAPPENRNSRTIFVTAALSGLTVAVWTFAPTGFLIAFLCLQASAIIGILLHLLFAIRQNQEPELLPLLFDLTSDRDIAESHASIAESLKNLTDQKDPIFLQLALTRLQTIAEESRLLGEGIVEFTSTESWRVVYEELLRSSAAAVSICTAR